MNKSVCEYTIASLVVLVFSLLSFQAHAGDVKIIIGGYGDSKHFYKGHNKHYRYIDRPSKYRYYNKSRHNYKHRLGNGDHYYGKKYYRNKYYGNKRHGYGNSYRYISRGFYRNNRNYCPY